MCQTEKRTEIGTTKRPGNKRRNALSPNIDHNLITNMAPNIPMA